MTNRPDVVPPAIPRRGGALTRFVGRLLHRILGWRVEGALPDRNRIVALVAPHSSNFDFLIAIALVFRWNLRVRYIGKKELFRFPLGPIMAWLGGIGVDRSAPGGIVDQVAAVFEREGKTLLGVAPEGTRRFGARWKSGFYRIAEKTRATLVPVSLDWSRRVITVHPPFELTGDSKADLRALVRIFAGFPRRDGRTIDVEGAVAPS